MKTNENIFNITTGTVVDEVIRMAEKTEIQTGHSVYENYMNKIYNIVVQSSYANEIPIPTEIYEKYSVLSRVGCVSNLSILEYKSLSKRRRSKCRGSF